MEASCRLSMVAGNGSIAHQAANSGSTLPRTSVRKLRTNGESTGADAPYQKPYSSIAFPAMIWWRSASGTPSKASSMYFHEWGQVESECG